MQSPDIKELKKLAAACRKAGITNFKFNSDGSYEFNLDPHVASEPTKRSGKKLNTTLVETPNGIFEADVLTPEQLLNWSSDPIYPSGNEGAVS